MPMGAEDYMLLRLAQERINLPGTAQQSKLDEMQKRSLPTETVIAGYIGKSAGNSCSSLASWIRRATRH